MRMVKLLLDMVGSDHQHAAVQQQRLAGHAIRFGAGQVNSQIGNLSHGCRKRFIGTRASPPSMTFSKGTPAGCRRAAKTGPWRSAQICPCWPALDDWFTAVNLKSALARSGQKLARAAGSYMASQRLLP